MAGNAFIMFHLYNNLDNDMDGIYFVQLTGNEEAIEKFKTINTNNDALAFYCKKYTFRQVIYLTNFEHLWNMGAADNVERIALIGKLTIPGDDKIYSDDELELWWGKYLGDAKRPKWGNISESTLNLVSKTHDCGVDHE